MSACDIAAAKALVQALIRDKVLTMWPENTHPGSPQRPQCVNHVLAMICKLSVVKLIQFRSKSTRNPAVYRFAYRFRRFGQRPVIGIQHDDF